ncbi:MAG: hypothetical protein ACOZE5_14555 [Verrucomicrobiota bacterium]
MKSKLLTKLLLICAALGLVSLSGCSTAPGSSTGGGHHHAAIKPPARNG